MDMRDDALPIHDYFIYVPFTQDDHAIVDEHPVCKRIGRAQELATSDCELSWTCIALADTLDVYARF